ncbi:peptidylprolyl isomerase [Novosphingobium sp. NBM11]|jgi:FKBP-type peptidyl-prolyl cis-trans isomerase FkpA|uniref:FKBP-type peptidyl-prolyl cis-trans isomerase n=1 Tax=unclassified Novosphingobium TaxID=2644732 RepID=UPI001891FA2F|nr:MULTISPECIES: FKBP-type peptidyl-prolyl cis-trans isomerase [unclassified Novosphingobium]MBF5090683.1 peptidylprolyl isomerase [Novosphingobium sp. NBM11]
MSTFSRAPRPSAIPAIAGRASAALAALALAVAPGFAMAAAPAAPAAAGQIIPLPLNPVIPASQRACALKTASGLGYTVLKPADGAKPTKDDFVLVNYIGYIAATGAVFDQGMQAAFPVGGVIPGFSEGLQLLPQGAIYRLCVPSAQGYGAQGAGDIPANADLVFQVELVDHKSAAEVEAMRKAAQAQQGAPGAAAAPQP